jgi:putative glutamine amidotransferase
VPTLGICRGLQVLNVAFGGSLIEHLPEGGAVAHRSPNKEPTPHRVAVEPGSALAAVLGAGEVEAQSWHHQAVRTAGEGLQVVARAADGVIEAMELPGHRWLIGVQWHPELSAATDPVQQRLFAALVAAARRTA